MFYLQIQAVNVSLSWSLFRSYTYETPSTYKNTSFTSAPGKSAEESQAPLQSSRLIPVWVQIVLFLAVAIFFYMVFASMETNESFKGVE